MDGEVSQNSLLASWVWEDATSFGSANLQDNECWSMIVAFKGGGYRDEGLLVSKMMGSMLLGFYCMLDSTYRPSVTQS